MTNDMEILVSVGTDHHRFDRMIDWVERWLAGRDDVRCFIQHGTSRAPRAVDGAPLLGHDELESKLKTATVVVSHGGPSTIADAWNAGHRPIVVPRDDSLGEHIDNHQMKFAKRMAATGRIHPAFSYSELSTLLSEARRDTSSFRTTGFETDLTTVVRKFEDLVEALVQRPRSRRHRSPA